MFVYEQFVWHKNSHASSALKILQKVLQLAICFCFISLSILLMDYNTLHANSRKNSYTAVLF